MTDRGGTVSRHVIGATVLGEGTLTDRPVANVNPKGVLVCDPLTGLPTRPLFVEQLQRTVTLAARQGWATVVYSIDIDEFQSVNERFGYDAGDELLLTVAARLRMWLRGHDEAARPDDVITRIGADHFLVLCEYEGDEQAAMRIAERLVDELGRSIELSAERIAITVSVGLAFAHPGSDPSQLILDAEAAQRHAKELGGARHHVFSNEFNARSTRMSEVKDMLQVALDSDEFVLLYQPIVSLETNRIVAVEALVRWDHPVRGLVAPVEFIADAETCGLIVPLGSWVMREACRQAARWHQGYPRCSLKVAVNVSARQFRSGLAETVSSAIADAMLDPTAVTLEMTETTVMDNLDRTVETLDELKALGLTLSIDDFGTGYSSLEYLYRMPLDEVKIDSSFIAGLAVDAERSAIVASIISLAHAMNKVVVAEGVETAEQLERLRTMGCDFAQGYYLARPMPAAAIFDYLAADATGTHLPRLAQDPPAVNQVNETVLIVDDADELRMLARMSLSAAGFTVHEAGNGSAGLALARQLRPACVLVDLGMPGMGGIEVCQSLRADPATAACTIVMLTSHAKPTDKAEAFLVGADDYMVKPFTPRDLVTRVRAAIRRRPTTSVTVDEQVESTLLQMLEAARELELGDELPPGADKLTGRQIEIVKRLLDGQRIPAIAKDLYLSQSTIRNHLSIVYRRLGVHSQEQLLNHLRDKTPTLS